MKVHGNARLLPRRRMSMCRRVRVEAWTVAQAAEAFDESELTVYRWLAPFDAGHSMLDCSCAPGRARPAPHARWRR